MTNTVRWGILSTGNIAHSFATGLAGADGAEIVAVGSRSQESADAFGDEFDIPNRHGSYEALANDPDVDVIYIGTPHPYHKDNSLLCIDAGKAVLCEKPFTINAKEAEVVINRAREKGIFLMEAMWTRFSPVMTRIRELIAEGTIGEVNMLHADFGFRMAFDAEHRLFNPNLGGGALLDVGIYPISLAYMVFGNAPDEVVSHAHLGESGVDEQSTMLFKYNTGQSAVLSCAIRTQTQWEAIISGTKGIIKVPNPWWQPQRFTLQLEGEDPQEIELPFGVNGYEYQAIEVMKCLAEGKTESDIMSLDETLTIMKTLDSIRAQWGLVYPMEQ